MNAVNSMAIWTPQLPSSVVHPARTLHIEMPQVKALLRASGVVCRVDKIDSNNAFWLTDVASTQTRRVSWDSLRTAMEQGVVRSAFSADADQALLVPIHLRSDAEKIFKSIPVAFRTDKAVAVMFEKQRWLAAIEKHGLEYLNPSRRFAAVLKDVERQLKEKCPYGMDALYLAHRTMKANEGDVRSLLPQFHLRGGGGGSRLFDEVEALMKEALDEAEDPSSGKLKAMKTYRALVVKLMLHNRTAERPRKCPSLPTVTRRFKERFSPYVICVRNEGKRRADQKYRETTPRVRMDRALEIVHYDDTDTAVFLTDERTGLPWGRAWLTVGIDEATQELHGMALSERARSTESAFEAVLNGIYPKNHDSVDFARCKSKWEGFGQPGIVNLDNASYNATLSLQASLLEFGIEVAFARPHHPTDKSDIEHFNHRFKAEFIQDLPGYVGPKEDREKLKDGMGSAVMTKREFRQRLLAWKNDEYSNTPNDRTGLTPREAWRAQFVDLPPPLPRHSPAQELMGTIIQELKFRDSGGLERMKLNYQSGPLAELRKRLGARAKVVVRYKPSDLSFIYVLNPFTKNYLRVPCASDPRYVVGLTNYQQHLVLKKVRLMKLASTGLPAMYEARMALVKDTKDLLKSKKMRQRKRAYQTLESGLIVPGGEFETVVPQKSSPLIIDVMVTAVEDMVADLDETEFEFDEEVEAE